MSSSVVVHSGGNKSRAWPAPIPLFASSEQSVSRECTLANGTTIHVTDRRDVGIGYLDEEKPEPRRDHTILTALEARPLGFINSAICIVYSQELRTLNSTLERGAPPSKEFTPIGGAAVDNHSIIRCSKTYDISNFVCTIPYTVRHSSPTIPPFKPQSAPLLHLPKPRWSRFTLKVINHTKELTAANVVFARSGIHSAAVIGPPEGAVVADSAAGEALTVCRREGKSAFPGRSPGIMPPNQKQKYRDSSKSISFEESKRV